MHYGICLISQQYHILLHYEIYRETPNISRTWVANTFFFTEVYSEYRLSALLELHLHSRLNTWLQRIGQIQLEEKTSNI